MKTYDPNKTLFAFAGNAIVGWESLKGGRLTDTFSSDAGTNGEVARVRSNDKRGEWEIVLPQHNAGNDIFSAAAAADELTGAGIYPLLLQDLNGTTVASAQNSWIVKPADAEYEKDLKSRTWKIQCDSLEIFNGGII